MALILRYFTEFGSFRSALHIKVVEDIPKLSATEMLPKVHSSTPNFTINGAKVRV